MKGELSESGKRILYALRQYSECPMTPREIASVCREYGRASDWAHGPLRTLQAHGLVEKMGKSSSGAHTYRISDVGRLALLPPCPSQDSS